MTLPWNTVFTAGRKLLSGDARIGRALLDSNLDLSYLHGQKIGLTVSLIPKCNGKMERKRPHISDIRYWLASHTHASLYTQAPVAQVYIWSNCKQVAFPFFLNALWSYWTVARDQICFAWYLRQWYLNALAVCSLQCRPAHLIFQDLMGVATLDTFMAEQMEYVRTWLFNHHIFRRIMNFFVSLPSRTFLSQEIILTSCLCSSWPNNSDCIPWRVNHLAVYPKR